MEGPIDHSRSLEKVELIQKIYELATKEHSEFLEIPEKDFKGVIETALQEIEDLESASDPREQLNSLTPEIAEKISALWVFSGPGTYDNPVKEDRYKNYPWARGMDHARLSHAAWLARNIAEIVSGKNTEEDKPMSEVELRKEEAREIIADNGPTIVYNGTELENSVVKDVLTRDGIIIPPEKVVVMGEGIDNTVHQVSTFVLPENLHKSGGEIGLVSHAPHLMRVMHMLGKYKSVIPEGMGIRLFPIATPAGGREEYTILEIKGLLYYIFLGKNAEAAAYPSIIHSIDSKK